MVLRKVERLGSGMRIAKPLRDDDIPERVNVISVQQGSQHGHLSVEFGYEVEGKYKSEAVEMYPDDLVQVFI